MKKRIDAKGLLAIYMLQGEGVPCMWTRSEYFWRDFEEVKYFNDDYLFLLRKEDKVNRHFIFSIKDNLLVDGFHPDTQMIKVLDDIREFEKSPREYGV